MSQTAGKTHWMWGMKMAYRLTRFTGTVLCWGRWGTCPQIHLFPQIQKLADRSDVISEAPKCSKIQIFRAPPRTPLEELTAIPQNS